MKEFVKISKALSDLTRLTIIKLIQDKERCVCEIQSAFDLSQPAISKHLKILEDSGLIKSEKRGLWVYYSLDKDTNSEYVKTILANIKDWFEEDKDLIKTRKKIKCDC